MTLDLYALRHEHGGSVYDAGRRWVGPGPGHSRHDASLSVRLADDGRALVHSFSGDPFDACAAHLGLRHAEPERLDRTEWLRRKREREATEEAGRRESLAFVAAVWDAVEPIEGTAAEAYLFDRGLILEGCPSLGWHPAAPRTRKPPGEGPAPHPAMVAAIRSAAGKLVAVHTTYLSPGGRKAFGDGRSRLIFGSPNGGAVRLSELRADGLLAVAEGIETSAHFGDRVGAPAWATLSTAGLQNFQPPLGVRKLLIGADSDDHGAGLASAHKLAERLKRSCEVEIHPAPEGLDWADPEARRHG